MFCPTCGRETESGGKYCQWCGADMKAAPVRAVLRKKVGGISTEKPAGLGARFVAGLIDIVIIVIIDLMTIALITVIAWIVQRPNPVSEAYRMIYQYYHHLPRTDGYGQAVTAIIPPQIILVVAILFFLVPWLYSAYLESSRNQATLGKLALRIAVTDRDGSRITFARATLRVFGKIVCIITLFIGFIIIAFTKYKRGLDDMIAGTLCFAQ